MQLKVFVSDITS